MSKKIFSSLYKELVTTGNVTEEDIFEVESIVVSKEFNDAYPTIEVTFGNNYIVEFMHWKYPLGEGYYSVIQFSSKERFNEQMKFIKKLIKTNPEFLKAVERYEFLRKDQFTPRALNKMIEEWVEEINYLKME